MAGQSTRNKCGKQCGLSKLASHSVTRGSGYGVTGLRFAPIEAIESANIQCRSDVDVSQTRRSLDKDGRLVNPAGV